MSIKRVVVGKVWVISISLILISSCLFENRGVSEADLWKRYEIEVSHKRYENAIGVLSHILELYPENVDAYISRSYFFCLIGQPELAIMDCEEALILAPSSSQVYNNLAMAYHQLDQHEFALNFINVALKLNTENAYAYKNRAKIHMALGNRYQACQDLFAASQNGYNDDFASLENDLNSLFVRNCEIVECTQ
ncbi:MAG: hypothetical protein AAGC85_21845 [Bacteroidota bacterium]